MRDPAAAVADLWDRIIEVAAALDDEDWDRPTPCADWDVHDLLAHCAAAQVEFDGGPMVAPPREWRPPDGMSPLDRRAAGGVVARRGWGPDEIRTELRAARDGHVTRLRRVDDWERGTPGPHGSTTEAGLLAVRCYDLWVHLQDLHVALGEPIDVGDGSDAAVTAHTFVSDRAPYLLARKATDGRDTSLRMTIAAPAPLDATVLVRDGRGMFATTAEPSSSTVRAAPEALTLLVSGREEPETWRDRGLLDWVGPVADAFVRKARLFD